MHQDIYREWVFEPTNPSKFWMVVGNGNNPKIRHHSKKSASEEAKRLAREKPGVDFYVLEAVEVSSQPEGITTKKL